MNSAVSRDPERAQKVEAMVGYVCRLPARIRRRCEARNELSSVRRRPRELPSTIPAYHPTAGTPVGHLRLSVNLADDDRSEVAVRRETAAEGDPFIYESRALLVCADLASRAERGPVRVSFV